MMQVQGQVQNVIDEVKNLRPTHVDSHFCARGGFLGSGYFSRAYLYNGVCVKLGGFNNTDPGGKLWAKWCLEHQHLPAVPEVHYMKEYEDGTYIVVMELLRSMDECPREQRQEFNEYADYIECGEYSCALPYYIVQFKEAFEEVRAQGCMDLHSGNYMRRDSDDCMVIIDPFSAVRR